MPGRTWRPEELDYLHRNVGKLPFVHIARRLKRTPAAIELKLKTSGRGGAARIAPGLSSPEVAAALGVARSTVERWLVSGFLPAKTVTLRKRITYRVSRADLVAFVLRGGLVGVQSAPQPAWRNAAAEGARLWAERMISDKEIAALLGCSRAHLNYLRRVKGFPQPARAGKDKAPPYYRRDEVIAWLDRNVAYWTPAAQRGFDRG